MLVTVHMLANQPEYKIRNVEIGNNFADYDRPIEIVLDEVFYRGQNEKQNVPGICSVSVGDVIEYNSKNYLILPGGFYLLTTNELITYVQLPRDDRALSTYAFTPNNLS